MAKLSTKYGDEEVEVFAQNCVANYLTDKASRNAMTVIECLQSTQHPAAEKYDIVELTEIAQDCPLPSRVVKAIEDYYDKLHAAANETTQIIPVFKRTPIQSILGKTIVNILQSELDPMQLVFIGAGGEVLFSASSGKLFDKDGFHFNLNELIRCPD
jgi:hypothetical protein